MELLKQKILSAGRPKNNNVLLVDSFINHQVDIELMQAIGQEFAHYYAEKGITRIVTVESSGIAPAAMTALALKLPLVILKKQSSRILDEDILQTTVHSFTKGTKYELTLKHEFMPKGERVLLIDDFLASGDAAVGVHTLITQAGAQLYGIGIVIEKAFQGGHERLQAMGCDVYSLARIRSMNENQIEFMDE